MPRKKAEWEVLVIHGPNLDLLGARENEIYGDTTLSEINRLIEARAEALGVKATFHQTPHEGEIVEAIGRARGKYHGIIINPAAFTHTSVAIRDAVTAVGIPTVEVHLSNVHGRERFRRHSYLAPVCLGQICGFGPLSYLLALEGLVSGLKS